VLALDSDADGNLYYRIVDAASHETGELSELKQERAAGIDGGVSRVDREGASEEGSPEGPHLIGDATVDSTGDGADPYSPRTVEGGGAHLEPEQSSSGPASGAGAQGGATGTVGTSRGGGRFDREPSARSEAHLDSAASRRSRAPSIDSGPAAGAEGASGGTDGSTTEDPLAGVTRKQAATDARVDACGEEPLVVQAEAECEPRPFADSSPVVASCSEYNPRSSTGLVQREENRSTIGQVQGPGGASASATAAGAGEAMTYQEGGQFDKPEHQPGMSLLLSLILCGTGQIYNGEVSKGIMMMVLCFLLWFVLLGWVVHIWSIVDSVVVAERINRLSGDNSQTTGPNRQLSSG
jgi:TM2 domain-containing membrane protein YozV